jgi:hypothetical protein
MALWETMISAEEASTIGAFEWENNILAAVLTLRRLFQLPDSF